MGATGCNYGLIARIRSQKLKPKPHVCRTQLPECHISFDHRISVCDALASVSNPEAEHVFGNTILPQVSNAVSAEGMKSRFCSPHLLEGRIQAASQGVSL